jgi:hypothetical protein
MPQTPMVVQAFGVGASKAARNRADRSQRASDPKPLADLGISHTQLFKWQKLPPGRLQERRKQFRLKLS